jgi:hypothetical protein
MQAPKALQAHLAEAVRRPQLPVEVTGEARPARPVMAAQPETSGEE